LKFPRAARITRRQDIDRIRKEGRTLKTSSLVLRVSSSPFAFLRAGIVVPRYGQTAVRRNRLKRQLREVVRHELLPLAGNRDVVIWALPPAYRMTLPDLAATLRRLAERMDGRSPLAP
jgi:ribonuclease P protein component